MGVYNSQIKEMYGNYGFWSWFQFWFLDSVFKQTIMLMDKTRIDYDYDKKKSIRHSNDPALDRELREYNKNEAVEFMRRKKAMRELSNEEKIEKIREERNKNK